MTMMIWAVKIFSKGTVVMLRLFRIECRGWWCLWKMDFLETTIIASDRYNKELAWNCSVESVPKRCPAFLFSSCSFSFRFCFSMFIFSSEGPKSIFDTISAPHAHHSLSPALLWIREVASCYPESEMLCQSVPFQGFNMFQPNIYTSWNYQTNQCQMRVRKRCLLLLFVDVLLLPIIPMLVLKTGKNQARLHLRRSLSLSLKQLLCLVFSFNKLY